MPHPNSGAEGTAPPIDEALEKNKQATEAVKQVAEELAIIHEVLDAGVSKQIRSDDVERAVEKTSEAEKRLNGSVEQLEEVNDALEKHASRENEDNAAG
ncbi:MULTISPECIES: hypothetical protein [unclassified Variovorax]|uniref:hypothetical protein n=1 Tax=unclassified Variovorax TaxID=663243 RepID=UPI00076C191A|nr:MULTISPECIES: hypothetical protein [unclassified Variovorax]KWT83892.1 hypothetical protein APY03_4447 [Variovorax sp. WDL1]PNG46575.1 hypothetical protein CHC06_06918 [Variovorax sp. B2]PNG47603.1 hypothetical protein CHC07_06769 [Variovorax sp. B4]VTV14345.1 hypothetical protein WDL1CHR_04891 [Variovorax sp. WDL1]